METIHLHDVVALTQPILEHNLRRGDVGTILDIGPNNHYLLEFANRNGVAFLTLRRRLVPRD